MTINVANTSCMTISPGEGIKNPLAVKKQHMLEYINMIVWNLNIAK